jgi:hypothetical protein
MSYLRRLKRLGFVKLHFEDQTIALLLYPNILSKIPDNCKALAQQTNLVIMIS